MTTRLADRDMIPPHAWRSTRQTSAAASWRTQRPILSLDACTGCMICWKFCPEPAITPSDGKVALDLAACKGCGVCAHECPVDEIRMEPEEH